MYQMISSFHGMAHYTAGNRVATWRIRVRRRRKKGRGRCLSAGATATKRRKINVLWVSLVPFHVHFSSSACGRDVSVSITQKGLDTSWRATQDFLKFSDSETSTIGRIAAEASCWPLPTHIPSRFPPLLVVRFCPFFFFFFCSVHISVTVTFCNSKALF